MGTASPRLMKPEGRTRPTTETRYLFINLNLCRTAWYQAANRVSFEMPQFSAASHEQRLRSLRAAALGSCQAPRVQHEAEARVAHLAPSAPIYLELCRRDPPRPLPSTFRRSAAGR